MIGVLERARRPVVEVPMPGARAFRRRDGIRSMDEQDRLYGFRMGGPMSQRKLILAAILGQDVAGNGGSCLRGKEEGRCEDEGRDEHPNR